MIFFQKCSPLRLLLSGVAINILAVFLGWYAIPLLIRSQIAANMNLLNGSKLRELWSNYPYPFEFKVYLFNVTNPMEVQNGRKPILREVGPYVYEEYKRKTKLQDHEEDDTVSYNNLDRWYFNKKKSGVLTGDEIITIPHLLILGLMLTSERELPAFLIFIRKVIPLIFGPTDSVFLTAKAKELLFDGLLFNCTLKDYSAKLICQIMKARARDFEKIGKNAFKFSFFGLKNVSLQDRLRAKRGVLNSISVGSIVEHNARARMATWSGSKCNEYGGGTDATVFPPFLEEGDSVKAFIPDFCRTLTMPSHHHIIYKGIKSHVHYLDFGDPSSNPDLKCFCTTPSSCFKRGVHDLTLCKGLPLAVSLPHFYMADEDYVHDISGLDPKQNYHETILYLEPKTGTPLLAYVRIQFNVAIHKIGNYAPMKDLPTILLPIFWIEESLELGQEYISELKLVLTILSIVGAVKWIMILIGGVLSAVGLFLLSQNVTTRAMAALGRISPEENLEDTETSRY